MLWPALIVCSVLKTRWPGLRGGERDLHRFAVANFAEQDHFGRLAQSRAQTGREIGKVLAQFALAEGRLADAGAEIRSGLRG